jgi:hypothetical protein
MESTQLDISGKGVGGATTLLTTSADKWERKTIGCFFLFLIMFGLIVFENIFYENEILRKKNVFLRVIFFLNNRKKITVDPRVETVPVIFWNHFWRRGTLHNTRKQLNWGVPRLIIVE